MNPEYYTRIKLLKIWQILIEYSSVDNPLSTTQVLSLLKRAGVPCDRRTLYGDVDVLIECGFDVHIVRSKENAYYTDVSGFTREDLFLISESVRKNQSVTISKTNAVIKGLPAASFDKSRKKTVKTLMPYLKKTVSGDVYKNALLISDAISSGRCVEFVGLKYDSSGKRVAEGISVVVSPLSVVYYGERYYLAYYDGEKVKSVAIDDLSRLMVVDADIKRIGLSAAAAMKKATDVVCGRAEKVTFIADNGLIGEVIIKFGELVDFVKQGESKVSFTVEVPVNHDLFGWCLATGGKIKINAPLKVRKQYEDFIKRAYDEAFG